MEIDYFRMICIFQITILPSELMKVVFYLCILFDMISDGLQYSRYNPSNDTFADAQPNGDGIFDLLCNVENLKEEELLPKMQEIAAAFKAIEDNDRGKGLKLVKSIAETLESHLSIRYKIGHVLHQQQFAGKYSF